MSYRIEIKKANDLPVSNWSGGITTQLAIEPKDAVYSERNFMWRVSSAKVEIEESIFTSLPSYKRILMVLDGHLKLSHEGYHSCQLKSFEKDVFLGSWVTKSFGKVTDFNLMMTEDCEGTIESIQLMDFYPIHFKVDQLFHHHSLSIYAYNGKVKLSVENEVYELNQGDLAVIYSQMDLEIILYNNDNKQVDVIETIINY